jgi:hypothetical protein
MIHLVPAMLAFGISSALLPAANAADTACTGTLSSTAVNGNLVVPDGQNCFLTGATVTGNVQVGTGATLSVAEGTTV